MAFNIKVSQIRDFATEVGNTASVQANTAKTGITAQQSSDITTNNAKVGITTQQANDITANNAKVSFPEAPQDGKVYARINGAWQEVVVSGGGAVQKAKLTITNPVIVGGVALFEIVPAPGVGKILTTYGYTAFGTSGAAATGNTTVGIRYAGIGGGYGIEIIMASSGNTYAVSSADNQAFAGDMSNRAFNVAVINTVDQTLTLTIHIEILYQIADTTTGFV